MIRKEAFVMIFKALKAAALAAVGGLVLATAAVAAVDPKNPDWPCVQKKVENLSVMAIWDGPPLDDHKDWFRAEKIPALVTKLASRRVPMEKATAAIDAFAASIPESERDAQLSKLFYGLFDTVNNQRRGIINGIEKYQRSQKARAEELEKQGVDIAKLRGDLVVARNVRQTFRSRVNCRPFSKSACSNFRVTSGRKCPSKATSRDSIRRRAPTGAAAFFVSGLCFGPGSVLGRAQGTGVAAERSLPIACQPSVPSGNQSTEE